MIILDSGLLIWVTVYKYRYWRRLQTHKRRV